MFDCFLKELAYAQEPAADYRLLKEACYKHLTAVAFTFSPYVKWNKVIQKSSQRKTCTFSPVSALRVHTDSSVVAGVSGIDRAALVEVFTCWATADSCGFHSHWHQSHAARVDHRRLVSHAQMAGAAPSSPTVCIHTLIYMNLGHVDLKKRLELNGEEKWKEREKENHLWSAAITMKEK